MKNNKFKSLVAIAAALICVGCVDELKEVSPAYNPEITDGEIKSVEFVIPGFVDEEEGGIQTKTVLTSKGFVWAEKDTVGIFPSKGNQIYYEMSSGAGSSSAVFDGGGWALKDEYLYSSYYPFFGNIYLSNSAIPVTYDTEVTQVGNNNSDHLGANAFMFAPETTLSDGKVTFKYWQLGSVLKPRVTLPAGTYTKLVLSTDEPIFVVSGKYDLTTGVDASSSTATVPDFVPVIVPDKDKSGVASLTDSLTINLEDVTFSSETELVAYIMAAPVDVSNIPITVTIYCEGSPRYRYEFVRTSGFVAQTNHNIRPNEKGLMSVANSSESANAAFAAGETSISLVDVTEDASLDLVLPETSEPVSIIMAADEGKCAMSVSYPAGATVPEELNIKASNGSDLTINTPESTVTLDGERAYDSVRAATASNTLIIDEDVTIGTLFLEKGNVQVYGEIMALNTDDLEEGETPTVYVYGDIQGQIDDDDVTVRHPITDVTLDQTSLELEPDETAQLIATAVPENAIYETITWTSSNTSVATVTDDGLVTAMASGECTITVDIDGKQATCSVNVKAVNAIDLSASGTANCYIVSEKGLYKFKAVQGNSNTSVGEVKGVKVLWESFGTNVAPAVGDLIKPDVVYADNYINFRTNDTYKEGNAVIAAYSDENCTEGNVLWSWHIWLTEQPGQVAHSNNSGILMDRNLGATSADPYDGVQTYGLLYQWGRKDPFVGSSTSPASSTLAETTITWPRIVCPDNNSTEYDLVAGSGNIDYAIRFPTTLIYRYSAKDWENEESLRKWGSSSKTNYDPCPPGYRVPGIDVWNRAGFPDHQKLSDDDFKEGLIVGTPYCSPESWYPATGAYTYSYELKNFDSSLLWSSDGISDGYGISYYIQPSSTGAYGYWGTFEMYSALSVRCCKDEDFGKVTSLTMGEICTSVPEGRHKQLTWDIEPDVFQNVSLSWASSNPEVATVSKEGLITGIKKGETTITASIDGITQTIYILVGDYQDGNIVFADNICKTVCVKSWDKDGDGELSYVEAGFVKEISRQFHLLGNSAMRSFDEFQYFVNCTSLTSYKYKSDGDNYADGVFEGMSSLVSITLPNSLTEIGENCFNYCLSLQSISLPSSIANLGYACFEGCTNLKTVTIHSMTPPTLHNYDTYYKINRDDPHTFYNVPGKIYVPSSVLTQYKNDQRWSVYSQILYGY